MPRTSQIVQLCICHFNIIAAGVGLTNGLIGLRQVMDPSFVPFNPAQDVVGTSATYGVYMAVSSNLRYQVMAGVCVLSCCLALVLTSVQVSQLRVHGCLQ